MIKKIIIKALSSAIIIIVFRINISHAQNTLNINKINSRAFVVLDRNSNTVLVGKNENQKRKMASTTKIMTATIIIENCNLNETIQVSKNAANVGG